MPGLAQAVEDRILRGLELWLAHRGRLEVDQDGRWLVPSSSRPGLLHRVGVGEDTCTCGDHRYTRHRCMHIWCAIFELALRLARPEIRFSDDPYGGAAGTLGRRSR